MERFVRAENGVIAAEFVWSDHILTWGQGWFRSDTLQIGDEWPVVTPATPASSNTK
jgi:hypothetical protein